MPASDPAEVDLNEIRSHANLIWGIAELLRGDYKQADYGKVILPLVVMRRLDQALEPTKAAVVAKAEEAESWSEQAREQMLARVAGQQFFNRSSLSFPQLLDDPGNIAIHLHRYVEGYSALARHAIDHFDFEAHIDRLDRSNLLYQVVARVCEVDLSPERVSNLEMGYLFEELIRRFAEQSNETAGEHFTPREVVRLMVNLLLDGDDNALSERGAIRTIFDAACGTGGMLSEGESQIRAMNDDAEVYLYGQELNPESYAICLADMLVKDKRAEYIVFGNSLSADGHGGERFHYGIANPPFGVDWSKVEVAHGVGRLLGRDGHGLAVSQDFMTWSCGDRLDPFFLLYALRALRPDLHRLMMGSTHQTIYMPDLHALRIPLPPVTDQQNAVAAIRRQLAPHWSLRARIEALHSRLAEYCDALITDAATGQIDVARVSGSQMEERVGAAAEGRLAEVAS